MSTGLLGKDAGKNEKEFSKLVEAKDLKLTNIGEVLSLTLLFLVRLCFKLKF